MNPQDSHFTRSTQNGALFQIRFARKGATKARFSRRIGLSQMTQLDTSIMQTPRSGNADSVEKDCKPKASIHWQPPGYGAFVLIKLVPSYCHHIRPIIQKLAEHLSLAGFGCLFPSALERAVQLWLDHSSLTFWALDVDKLLPCFPEAPCLRSDK